jgi:hypothetical protein
MGNGTVGHGDGTITVSCGVGLPVGTVGVVGVPVPVATVDVPAGVTLRVGVGGGTVAVCWGVTLACGSEPGKPGRDSV